MRYRMRRRSRPYGPWPGCGCCHHHCPPCGPPPWWFDEPEAPVAKSELRAEIAMLKDYVHDLEERLNEMEAGRE